MSHFYDKLGNPVYQVPNISKGGMRDTTLADARKLGLNRSVTTIIGAAASPGLDNWKQNQLLDAAVKYRHDYLYKPTSNLEFRNNVLKESEAVAKNAARLGTSIHDSIEKFIKTKELDDLYSNHITAVMECLLPIMAEPESELSFAHIDGFGGKVDCCSRKDKGIIIDFKTKDKDDLSGKLCYDNHIMQLAAYREGLKLPEAKCYNLFISTSKSGLVRLIEHSEKDIQKGWKMFSALLNYIKVRDGY